MQKRVHVVPCSTLLTLITTLMLGLGWTAQAQTRSRANAQPRHTTSVADRGVVAPSVTCGSGTNNWNGSAGDSQWTTAKNWSSGAVPVSTDNVCIASTFTSTITIGSLAAANQTIASLNAGAPLSDTSGPLTISGTATFAASLAVSGTLTLNGTSSMTTLQQTAGTLNGTGTLTVSGLLTWSGGTEGGSGVTNATGGVAMSGEPFLDTRTLNNSGTAAWNGSAFFMLNTAVFNNKSGATWNTQNDSQIEWDGGTPTFNNAGTFEKTGGTSASGGGVGGSIPFNNTGTVLANSGILMVGDAGSCTGTCAGSWSVASGATLQLSTAATSALSGPISGAGTVVFLSGTVNYTGSYAVTGGTQATNGTANFTAPATVTTGPLSLSGGTLNFSTGKAITTSSITQTAGTLTGSDTVTVSGAITWSGGTESGTGVTNANGGMTLSGEPFLDTRTLNNAKTATWNGSAFFMLNTAVFNNMSGATWNTQNDSQIGWDGGSPTFSNAGTFEKTGGTSASGGGLGGSLVFNNTGSVLANSGILMVGDAGSCTGTCAGSWSVASGATLQLGTATTAALKGPISGAGTVVFSTGTVNYTGTYNVTGGTQATDGTANFTAPATVTTGALSLSGGTLNFSTGKAITTSAITQTAGTLTGSDTLTVSGAITWSGGTESGTGVTNANGGMTMSGEPFLDTRTVNNAKTAAWNGSAFFMLNTAVFNNMSGATWNTQNDSQIEWDGGTPTFSNAGTFEKTGGTSASGGGIGGSLVFNNTGSVLANSGILMVGDAGSCTGTCAGSWSVASGATLQLGTATTAALKGPISGAGTVIFSTGTVNYTGSYNVTGGTQATDGTANFTAPATVTSTGALSLSGGTLNFSTGKAVTAKSLTQDAGTLTGSDALTVSGAITWSGGTESGTGVTNADDGMTISGEPFLDTRTINNKKIATWNGSAFFMLNTAVFDNKAGATWNHQVDTLIEWDGGTPTFINGGTFEKTAGTSASGGGMGGSIPFTNSGTVIAKSGMLLLGTSYTQTGGSTELSGGTISMSGSTPLTENGGSVLGIGTITGNLTNNSGTVSPTLTANTTGTLSINGTDVGDYVQGTKGTLVLDIGGSGSGQFDVLSASGPATLAGSAQLCLIKGFKPTVGSKFPIVNYASESGTFSTVNFGWTLTYGSTAVTATYNGAPVTSFSPASLAFPSQLLKTTSSPLTETLTNVGQAALTITSVGLTGANASDYTITSNTCGSSLAIGAKCTVTVTFTPSALGARSASLVFTDNGCLSPQTIPITGKGSEITLSPSPVNFGSQTVGTTSAPMTVTVTNNGTTSVTVTKAAIAGTNKGDFAITSNNCKTLAAGGTCTIEITFTPAATGARTGSLSLTDSDKGSPQTDVLNGTGS